MPARVCLSYCNFSDRSNVQVAIRLSFENDCILNVKIMPMHLQHIMRRGKLFGICDQ